MVALSRSSEPSIDLTRPEDFDAVLAELGPVDAIVATAASAPLTQLTDPAFATSFHAKLLGQVELTLAATRQLADGGSITLTTGAIAAGTAGSAGGALTNAGLEAFVQAAAIDLERGLRINAISPGWISETLAELGRDPDTGTPAALIAEAYVAAVEADINGRVLRLGAAG